ncbi:MAG: bifunctional oligoribonuclease/PAP phosphatase NrnA [Lachnospiraceae bacterium]|nr:bifunctional oligoribonuclease/PAP phosphatase NrnA [Lachnospiraceae bacterium]
MIILDDLLREADTIGISGHVRPDGDAIGSSLALYLYIKKNYSDKKVYVFLENPSQKFAYLKGLNEIADAGQLSINLDLFFALDLGDEERLGKAAALFRTAKKRVCVDHHISNKGFGDQYYIDANASSTAELIYLLMDEERIDEDIAKCVYTGIIHDTGVLQYSNTSRRTFEVTGKLIEFGFDFSEIIDSSFYERSYKQNLILGRVLMESQLSPDGNCISSVVTRQIMEFYDATSHDLDGVVNQLLYTKDVECAVLMYEPRDTDPIYKVSLRSHNKVDVSVIAQEFGGGGHRKAAGFQRSGDPDIILKDIMTLVDQQLLQKNRNDSV